MPEKAIVAVPAPTAPMLPIEPSEARAPISIRQLVEGLGEHDGAAGVQQTRQSSESKKRKAAEPKTRPSSGELACKRKRKEAQNLNRIDEEELSDLKCCGDYCEVPSGRSSKRKAHERISEQYEENEDTLVIPDSQEEEDSVYSPEPSQLV